MIIIYTPYPSSRLKYVLNYVFTCRLGLEWQLVDSILPVDPENRFYINYSDKDYAGYYQVIPAGLLSETLVKSEIPVMADLRGMKVLYPDENIHGFDLFSAVFYCLSRYEEYQIRERDVHGRFSFKNSVLWKNNCLHLPIVDFWVKDIKFILKCSGAFGKSDFRTEEYAIHPTIDIDAAFTYKGRGIVRQIAGFAKSVLQLNVYEFRKRFNVLFRGEQDPNDNFDYQLSAIDKADLKANYFIQIGAYGTYDKNIHADNKAFRRIIKNIADHGHAIGLHPSYQSAGKPEIIRNEKHLLEDIIGESVNVSRQHYLRFDLPNTYRVLQELGFRKEFSMGYSEVTGFRAGTSRPFYWYDLEREEATQLEIVPFVLMDVAYKQFMKSTVEQTLNDSATLKKVVKSVDGLFGFVFHNESLSGHRGWEQWNSVFESWLKQ